MEDISRDETLPLSDNSLNTLQRVRSQKTSRNLAAGRSEAEADGKRIDLNNTNCKATFKMKI